ncbi:iron-containing alcohol dehydrogenase [Peribacillus frigoritolerans]|nr:iron-containing alcohol dehydrogenase [Peribacillus frigoritolerans]
MENEIESVVFSEVEPNPQAETVMRGANFYKQNSCDMILAIGGGSPMDFAKAVGVVVSHSGHILDYRRGEKVVANPIPLLFAIPTTVGTGSEVTAAAVVTDPTIGRKYVVASPHLVPKMAFIDPLMTITLPKHHVSATALDALVHAIESYTSVRATPISDGLALQAIRMIETIFRQAMRIQTTWKPERRFNWQARLQGWHSVWQALALYTLVLIRCLQSIMFRMELQMPYYCLMSFNTT